MPFQNLQYLPISIPHSGVLIGTIRALLFFGKVMIFENAVNAFFRYSVIYRNFCIFPLNRQFVQIGKTYHGEVLFPDFPDFYENRYLFAEITTF